MLQRSNNHLESSKQSLSDLCFGKQAEVTTRVVDRYKRVVANVKCDDVNVNAEQISRGMAWTYQADETRALGQSQPCCTLAMVKSQKAEFAGALSIRERNLTANPFRSS